MFARAGRRRGRRRRGAAGQAGAGRGEPGEDFVKSSAKCCSSAALSAPIFESKYAFFSILGDLQDYLAEIWKMFVREKKFAYYFSK